MCKKSYIKEAERNIINQSVAFQDMLKVIEALERFGNLACKEYVGKKEFFEGLQLMRMGVYAEFVRAQSELLMFAGIGGKDAQEFAKKRFEEFFGEKRYAVMHLLDRWGQNPCWYKTADEEAFRAEAKDKIKELLPDPPKEKP